MRRWFVIPMLLFVAALGGCRQEGAGGSGTVTELPDQPDAAVKAFATAIANNDPEVVWHGLPASYQKDVEGLLDYLAENIDPQLWNQTFAILQKAGQLLEEKKQFILNHPMVPVNASEVNDQEWRAAASTLSTIANSRINKLENLKDLDVAAFLDETGGELMDLAAEASAISPGNEFNVMMQKLKNARASTVKQDGNTATVKLEIEGYPAEDLELVRVDGKWILKDMRDQWAATIQDIKETWTKDSELEARSKPQIVQFLPLVESDLDKLLAANSQEEFNNAFNQTNVGMLIALGGGDRGGPGFGPAGPAIGPGSDDFPSDFSPDLPEDENPESAKPEKDPLFGEE